MSEMSELACVMEPAYWNSKIAFSIVINTPQARGSPTADQARTMAIQLPEDSVQPVIR